jgi:hypothetical protein
MMVPEAQLARDDRRHPAPLHRVADAGRGEHRALPDAAHSTIPLVRPDAVADAVRDLLARM